LAKLRVKLLKIFCLCTKTPVLSETLTLCTHPHLFFEDTPGMCNYSMLFSLSYIDPKFPQPVAIELRHIPLRGFMYIPRERGKYGKRRSGLEDNKGQTGQ